MRSQLREPHRHRVILKRHRRFGFRTRAFKVDLTLCRYVNELKTSRYVDRSQVKGRRRLVKLRVIGRSNIAFHMLKFTVIL